MPTLPCFIVMGRQLVQQLLNSVPLTIGIDEWNFVLWKAQKILMDLKETNINVVNPIYVRLF